MARALDGSAVPLEADGESVDLTFPVQGGHVLFIGARVKNLGACRSDLYARLIDPEDGRVYAEERRQVKFSVPAGEGFGQSEVSDTTEVANVPACPDFLDRDIVGQRWRLEVTVTDEEGRSASQTREVVPVCRQGSDYERGQCECECRGGYVLGRCSEAPDAG